MIILFFLEDARLFRFGEVVLILLNTSKHKFLKQS